ncbi:MAG: hypothetical protein CM15mP66_12540 [Pseudomonadota bacterium]|nr:MAG: hypothetical protein CM15mP66_12540 [Pseudomonadota bacterium]
MFILPVKPSTESPMLQPVARHVLAVESRMNPVFVHNPDGGESLAERFSLEGNPDPKEDWTKIKIEYLDQEEKSALKEIPLTPADFAATEGRFRTFHVLPQGARPRLLSTCKWIPKKNPKPFISGRRKTSGLLVSQSVIGWAEERLRNWRAVSKGQPVQEMENITG